LQQISPNLGVSQHISMIVVLINTSIFLYVLLSYANAIVLMKCGTEILKMAAILKMNIKKKDFLSEAIHLPKIVA